MRGTKFIRRFLLLDMYEIQQLHEISKNIRKDAIKMAHKASSSHVGAALSIIDILIILYYKVLNVNPETIYEIERDKFILSKGHAVSGLYATLASRQYFDKKILELYDEDGSPMGGHPKMNSVAGIEASTGSLGHGLAIGCGLALSDKVSQRTCKTVVLMGDGECNEGSIWEAAMFASAKKLNNLIGIIDSNKLQGYDRTEKITGYTQLSDKWSAFGWSVTEIDGHDFEQIYSALISAYNCTEGPSIIIAHTIKGKGVSFMEDKLEWHYKSPNKEQLENALKEIN